MERRIAELEIMVKEFNTFMIQSKAENRHTEGIPDKVCGLETKITALEGRCTSLEDDTETNEEKITKIVDDEKDKVKVWKRNTIALGTIILGAIINFIIKGQIK